MAIIILCPDCKTRLTLGDDRAGETFECPRCDTAITIPMPLPAIMIESGPKGKQPAQDSEVLSLHDEDTPEQASRQDQNIGNDIDTVMSRRRWANKGNLGGSCRSLRS